MTKIFKIAALAFFGLAATTAHAQTTAYDFNKPDCNGIDRHLFSDLDSGKAVVLFYYMPSCGTCPPPAAKIQTMVNNINANHPGMVKGYAFPFNDVTTCAYSASWVTSNNLNFYIPMDSGTIAVAHYGGFGMPSVVLVGGTDHRVMFSTLSFNTSDTTIMRDSILALLGVPNGINDVPSNVNELSIYPNPTKDQVNISIDLKNQSDVHIDLLDITGKHIAVIADEKNARATISADYNTSGLASGLYIIRMNVAGAIVNRKLNVLH